MTGIARAMSWLRHAIGRTVMERDMAEELAFHLDARATDLEAGGLTREAAMRQARLEFGGVEAYKDDCRQARGLRLLDDLRGDLRYAIRTLTRTPTFTLTAIVSLALGIGVNTIVFSVVNALVLKPLPIERPQDVVFLQTGQGFPSQSFPNYRDLRDQNVSLAGLVGYRPSPINLESGAAPVRTWGYLATGNYFDVLGVKPALGRFFHQEDDLHEGDAPFAVISYDAWTTRFGADPHVVGRMVRLNRTPFTIIGPTSGCR
jgi:MacB-like periplasmic core domain